MQLLGHVVFYVSVKLRATHDIGIILKGSGAELACTWVPRRHNAPGEGALMVRGGAIVMRMVSGEAPSTDLPQRAVVFVVVGGLLVAFETVREWGGGTRALALVCG